LAKIPNGFFHKPLKSRKKLQGALTSAVVGYKFITGNVGRVGKKVTLPHYMSMFV
jgi:hypothetical protein